MQADLEGRRSTQLWLYTDTGTRTLGVDESSKGVPALFPDSPTSFELNVGGALDSWCAQSTGAAMPSHRVWQGPASEGTLEL